jgi:hypothetical protein
MVLGKLDFHLQNNKIGSYTKIISKWIKAEMGEDCGSMLGWRIVVPCWDGGL